jgi:hypothetical protein
MPSSQPFSTWLREMPLWLKTFCGIVVAALVSSLVGLIIEYKSGWFIKRDPVPVQVRPLNPQVDPSIPAGPERTKDDTTPPRPGEPAIPTTRTETQSRTPAQSPTIGVEVIADPDQAGFYRVIATLKGPPEVSFQGKVDFKLNNGISCPAPVINGQASWTGLRLERGKYQINASFVPANQAAAGTAPSASIEYDVK